MDISKSIAKQTKDFKSDTPQFYYIPNKERFGD